MKKYIIDRLEGSFAVCETEEKEIIHIETALLPADAAAGCMIYEVNGIYTINQAETAKRREQMKKKLMELFQD